MYSPLIITILFLIFVYVVALALMGRLTIIRERLLDSLREADGTTD